MTSHRAWASCILLLSTFSVAQQKNAGFPNAVTITRHTFIDVGPPFDFYEVIELREKNDETYVQRVLVTPGDACRLNTSFEIKTAKLGRPLRNVLLEKNPCDISAKALKKEQKRCKHCLIFSGQNVTLGLTCNGEERRIRADILDRDLFDKTPNTPENTSWTMQVLAQLDEALGPGALDKPIFATNPQKAQNVEQTSSNLSILENVKKGSYDDYFKTDKKLSQLYRESLEPPALPPVEMISFDLQTSGNRVLPIYPPIARAAHVEGIVEITFDVSRSGEIGNIQVVSGPKLLEKATRDAVSQWIFPPSSEIHHEQAKIAFRLNCK